jgi:hypothetical protein
MKLHHYYAGGQFNLLIRKIHGTGPGRASAKPLSRPVLFAFISFRSMTSLFGS